jgi:hypothetical protein
MKPTKTPATNQIRWRKRIDKYDGDFTFDSPWITPWDKRSRQRIFAQFWRHFDRYVGILPSVKVRCDLWGELGTVYVSALSERILKETAGRKLSKLGVTYRLRLTGYARQFFRLEELHAADQDFEVKVQQLDAEMAKDLRTALKKHCLLQGLRLAEVTFWQAEAAHPFLRGME